MLKKMPKRLIFSLRVLFPSIFCGPCCVDFLVTSSNENAEWTLCMRWLQSLVRTVGSADEIETGCDLFLDARLTTGKLESSVHVLWPAHTTRRRSTPLVPAQTSAAELKTSDPLQNDVSLIGEKKSHMGLVMAYIVMAYIVMAYI